VALGLASLNIRQGHPDFLDLPWHLPLEEWLGKSERVVELERGLSRHEVLFASYGSTVYALKELPPRTGQREYEVLRALEERGLPSVLAVGLARTRPQGSEEEGSVLITQFLERSLPYRTLFMQPGLERYRQRLIDAVAILLVRLHVGGCFWGDCSLSNTLFRRDAGELQAYLVDAETSEVHERLSDGQRSHDLDIMEENVAGGLADLAAMMQQPLPLDVDQTGKEIRARYLRLWSEIQREVIVTPADTFTVQERIRTLNALGFSVGEVELVATGEGNQLRMRTTVTDRDYHRHLLQNLTGLIAEEHQAQLLLNELKELKVSLSGTLNRSVPLSVAAYKWLNERFLPTTQALQQKPLPLPDDPCELYCEVLEHKWFLSEREKKDVGLQRAVEDYQSLKGGAKPAKDDWDGPVI